MAEDQFPTTIYRGHDGFFWFDNLEFNDHVGPFKTVSDAVEGLSIYNKLIGTDVELEAYRYEMDLTAMFVYSPLNCERFICYEC